MAKAKKPGTAPKFAAPDDLDARLRAEVGVSAAEMAQILSAPCIAGELAKAAAPLMGDPPKSRADLARAIVGWGVEDVRKQLRQIYAPFAGAAPTTEAKEDVDGENAED